MSLAPIVLFVYNRPEHTSKTLESLMVNELASDSELFIFADGAKQNATKQTIEKIGQTRKIIKEKKWCKKVTIFESNENKGLAISVIEGVSKIVNEFGKVIVLEDDLVTSTCFLQFMNEALNIYVSENSVACISGYMYPVKDNLPETFFIKGADCWGWATWKRGWDIFEKDGEKLLKELNDRSLTNAFDFEGTYPYMKMLTEQIEAKNDSWAIRWYASAFLKNKYCLYPGISLVKNIGIDGSGTHSGVSEKWNVILSSHKINVNTIEVAENLKAKKSIVNYFMSINKGNHPFIKRLLYRLKSMI
jgi:hypothetical protein